VIGVCPGCHDLVNAHASAAHREVFRRPDSTPAAIPRGRDPPADIADVPGHIVDRHNLRRGLGNRVDDRVFNERRQSERNAQCVHRKDQLVGADLIRRDRFALVRLNNLRTMEYAKSDRDEDEPV